MENSQSNQCIIITGMHRSGTSLTASLLQNAGMEIGDRLMGATEWNPKGFFEDWDFVELHQAILSSQGIAPEGWTKEKLVEVQGQYLATAQNLILARKNKLIWGWKDPRTTLFVDFWLNLIPQAKFIFVFRSPWEVVDSLFRRGDIIFDTNPNFAIEQWSIYNEAILDFYQHHQEQCLLLDINSIINNSDNIINLINQKFRLELKSPESTYEPSLFTVDRNIYYRQALITKLFPDVIDLYSQLQQQADATFATTLDNSPIELTYESWFLQDWHDIKQALKEKAKLETQKQELEAHLAKTQANEALLTHEKQQLKQIEASLKQQLNETNTYFKQKLNQTEAYFKDKLNQTEAYFKDKLNQTEASLNQQLKETEAYFKDKLNQTEASLNQQLNQSQEFLKQIEQLKVVLSAMESSKFWKLRILWLRIKRKLNIGVIDSAYENYVSSLSKKTLTPESDSVDINSK